MICTWLTELYLDDICHNRDTAVSMATMDSSVADLLSFLAAYRSDLDRDTTVELLSSHGRVDELLAYAELIGDLEWAINYHVQQGNYQQALDALVTATTLSGPSSRAVGQSPSQRPRHEDLNQLVYKFAPVLMEHLPQNTVSVLTQVRLASCVVILMRLVVIIHQ